MNDHIWFDGPVAEAVKLVSEKNLVFLVYIYGKLLERLDIVI